MHDGDISTFRLRLRRLTPADQPKLLEFLDDYEITRNLARWPHPVDPAMVDELIARHQTDTPGGYAILYGDELAGLIGDSYRVGFFVGRPFWGLGIATEALGAVQAKLLTRFEALEGDVFIDNPASARVFEKCGWREVGAGESYSRARDALTPDRHFVKCARYDWLEPVHTERLLLRPLGPQDFDAVWAIVSDEAIVRMLLSWPWPAEEDYTRSRLSNAIARAGLASAILRDGETVGMIGCTGGSLWYALSRDHWGQGIATEAARAKIGQAFADPSVNRLIAGTWDDNPSSAHILKKLGFVQTGHDTMYHGARGEDASGPDFELTRQNWEALL